MVSLKDAIANKTGSPDGKSSVQFRNMEEILSGARAFKIQIEGEQKCGKTRFCLSVLNYLYFERGLKPEEILMVWVDLDNGVIPLIDQKLIPDELVGCIEYELCKDFGEVLEATEKGLDMLREHSEKYGGEGAWIVIDNMGKAWEGARDYYSRSVYGKTMRELMFDAKKRAINRAAAKTGKKSGRIPVQEFDQLTDYGVINPLHNDWAEEIKDSNINFIWTALLKYEEKEIIGNKRTVIARGEGQKHNSARVDFLIRKKKDDTRYLTDLIGSRYTSHNFSNVEDLDFTTFKQMVDDIMAKEAKLKDRHWDKERSKIPKQDEEPAKIPALSEEGVDEEPDEEVIETKDSTPAEPTSTEDDTADDDWDI